MTMKARLIAAAATAAALTVLSAPALAPLLQLIASGDIETALSSFALLTPEQALGWWMCGGALASPVGLLALACCLLATCLPCALCATSSEQPQDGGALGSARIKEGREAILGSDAWDGRNDPKDRGYVYGFSHGLYLFESSSPHVLVDGQTGSGKTRFQVIPTLDLLTFGEKGDNVVVTDVKGELYELCAEPIAERGYKVLLLDARHPARGHRFNPIAEVCSLAADGDVQGAQQAAEEVADAIVPNEEGSGKHFAESARALLAMVILFVACSDNCPDDQKHMATVCHVIDEGTGAEDGDPAARLKALARALPVSHPARPFASQLLSSGGNELRSTLSTLKRATRLYSTAGMAWLTSASDIAPTRVLEEKTALFLHVMDEGSPCNALFAILFDQIYREVFAVAGRSGGKLPRKLRIVGDEWGNLPEVKCLPSMLSLGRSYGLSWYGSLQNVAQLNRYGEKDGRRKVLANCGVKVALKLGESEDRAYFTEMAGKTTRHTTSVGRSHGVGTSTSTSYAEQADHVIHEWEWLEMSPAKDGAIVFKQAENGGDASRAGTFRVPLADCTETPTKEHFDLGTPEHEMDRRLTSQAVSDKRAESRDLTVRTWAPKWPEGGTDEEAGTEVTDDEPGRVEDEWNGICLD